MSSIAMSGSGGSGSAASVESALALLSKSSSKLERMAQKLGTHADNEQFRDLLAQERKNGSSHARDTLEALRAFGKGQASLVSSVEREYTRFAKLVQRIDTKQKQQLIAISQQQHNPLADTIMRESGDAGRNEFAQAQLPDEGEIQFLEYRIDEAEQRHGQILAIETDIGELAEMWRDLQSLVDEQQVHIDVIDSAITQTRDKTESAMQELQQAEKYQTSARKKSCCVLMILLIIIGVIVLIVLGLKHQF